MKKGRKGLKDTDEGSRLLHVNQKAEKQGAEESESCDAGRCCKRREKIDKNEKLCESLPQKQRLYPCKSRMQTQKLILYKAINVT